ncbi:TIGR01777 family oxidoreductase [Macrococcus animalis]|uniref:TIGR01777 family oxidoreductase n=1 Tax=Macrococcus animalis TaxID=3395467 RepID=UPI0039BDFD15
MNILITGGTGLVGTVLTDRIRFIFNDAHIFIPTRTDKKNHNNITYINWSENQWYTSLPRLDLVINLAGASLNSRWTSEHKDAIIKSRVECTEKLISIFESQQHQPFFISASAVGYYPPSKSLIYDERNTFESFDFLSKTVYLWEQAAHQIEAMNVPTAICRFGVVFSNKGGALPLMMKPYQLIVGGKIGDGDQPYSWIHIDDLVDSMLYIYEQKATGVFNLTAPIPVTQTQLGKEIAKITKRPHWTIVPNKMMSLILGEQSIMVTNGQHVLPNRLLEIKYVFQYPTIKSALNELYGK